MSFFWKQFFPRNINREIRNQVRKTAVYMFWQKVDIFWCIFGTGFPTRHFLGGLFFHIAVAFHAFLSQDFRLAIFFGGNTFQLPLCFLALIMINRLFLLVHPGEIFELYIYHANNSSLSQEPFFFRGQTIKKRCPI